MKLRYPGTCRDCGVELAKGAEAIHIKSERKVVCLSCWAEDDQPQESPRPSVPPPAPVEPEPTAVVEELPPEPTIKNSLPGSSAQHEYDRRHQKREDELVRKWGKAGKVIAWWQDDPQSTRAWSSGAKGEREAGLYLEKKLRETSCEILHDRLIPGSRANIDHLVVGPGGVTVLDTKNYKGDVRTRKVGIGRSRRTLLIVDGRDKTKLIEGVRKQIAAVQAALEGLEHPSEVPVAGGLLWWHYQGLPLFGSLSVDEIPVFSPKEGWKVSSREGPLGPEQIGAVAIWLDGRLKPAG